MSHCINAQVLTILQDGHEKKVQPKRECLQEFYFSHSYWVLPEYSYENENKKGDWNIQLKVGLRALKKEGVSSFETNEFFICVGKITLNIERLFDLFFHLLKRQNIPYIFFHRIGKCDSFWEKPWVFSFV